MSKITDIKAREVLDSRGNPTVECDVILSDNSYGRSIVPSGASTGKHEAIELRDENLKRFKGKGVKKAISNILEVIKPKILKKEFKNYNDFDNEIIKIDNTKNKSNLGANSLLALSIAFAKAHSSNLNIKLYDLLKIDTTLCKLYLIE